jgi:hypothetical protein
MYVYSAHSHFPSNSLPTHAFEKARARPVKTRITYILQRNTRGKAACIQPKYSSHHPMMLFQHPNIIIRIKSCLTTSPPAFTRRRPRNHNLERSIPAPTKRCIRTKMLRRRWRQRGWSVSRMLATALWARASRALWAIGTGVG